jgi:hypothetical protein
MEKFRVMHNSTPHMFVNKQMNPEQTPWSINRYLSVHCLGLLCQPESNFNSLANVIRATRVGDLENRAMPSNTKSENENEKLCSRRKVQILNGCRVP